MTTTTPDAVDVADVIDSILPTWQFLKAMGKKRTPAYMAEKLAALGFTITRAEPAMSEASEADPMLLKVLNFIERCRSLQIISGGGNAVDKAAEREDLRTSSDALYKELEAVNWGVRTAPSMSDYNEALHKVVMSHERGGATTALPVPSNGICRRQS